MPKTIYGALVALAIVLSAALPAAAQSFSPQQKQEIDKLIHDYLEQHPEAILQSLKAAQAKAATDQAAQQSQIIASKRAELLHDPNSAVAGNPNGDVTLVEFFDYRCPYCKAMQPSLDTLIKQDHKLRVVYKEFPILGPVSVFASRAAIAARKQGKYAAFHDRMMALRGTIDDDAVMNVAKETGLDLTELKADMASAETDAIIQHNYALADALGIDGTPALVIGKKLVMSALDLDRLQQLVAAARKAKNGS